jgi:hypothetical protein
MLATAALGAMGYRPSSLLGLHMAKAHRLYLQHSGQAGATWNRQYQDSTKKMLGHIARQPLGVQRAIHNATLHALVSKNPRLQMSKPSHLNGFMKALHENHNGLARHFGMPSVGAPPKISPMAKLALGGGNPGAGLGQKALGVAGAGGPQRPDAGVNTAGIPRLERSGAERASLGMNPLPPQMRHPQPLSMAPGPAQMPGAKALANPMGTPASEGGLT